MAKLCRFIVPGLVSVLFACPGMYPAMASGNSGLPGILATLDVEKAADMGNRYLKRNNPDASVRPDSALVCFEEVVSRYDEGRESIRTAIPPTASHSREPTALSFRRWITTVQSNVLKCR